MTVKNKTKKFISVLFIILILVPSILFSFPKKGYALWGAGDVSTDPVVGVSSGSSAVSNASTAASNVAQLGLKLKDVAIEVGKQLLKAIAKRVLAEMTKSIINWINSGFHGSPLFLENPDSFFNDIAKSELKTMVDMFGYNALLYPFGKDFALNAIASYKSQLAINAQYTLSNVMNSTLYRTNFNYGGWNAFLINTQYPQNNYLGFQMLANEELARRLQGTVQNAAQKYQTVLQQGMGFLSPQTCPSNPSYNNGTNEFQKPSFDSAKYNQEHPYPTPSSMDDENVSIEDQRAALQWTLDYESEKAQWAEKNTCPGGLVNTTPGSIAKDQIAGALNAPILQTALDGALGNSLSAIFDALINKFIGDGLNVLSSKVSPAPIEDDWSYNGITLGSPAPAGTNSAWNFGPEQPIVLGDFKQMIDDAIGSTITELKLIYNDVQITTDATGKITNDPDNYPGIYQMLEKIWPKAQELDGCIPGPDMGFQDRLDAEAERTNKEIQEKSSSMLGGLEDADDSKMVEKISKGLTFAVKLFKSWIEDEMMFELPSSLIYMDAVSNLKTLSQQADTLTDERIAKNRALVRLRAIKINLDTIGVQPLPGSEKDRILVSIWKQYQAASSDFSNTNAIEQTRNKLSEIKDMYNNLIDSLNPSNPTSCPAQRTAKGWSNPGGPDATLKNEKGIEKDIFCNDPIYGGYSHDTRFINKGSVTHPEIPLVNAEDVLHYKVLTLTSAFKAVVASFTFSASGGFRASSLSPLEDAWSSVNLDCDTIFNASLTDYKGNLPGNVPASSANTINPILGNCRYSNGTIETNMTQRQCELNTGTWGPLEPLGTCTMTIPNTNPVQTLSVPNTTQSDCLGVNGTWTANSGGTPTTNPPATTNNLVIIPSNALVNIGVTSREITVLGGTPPYVVVSPQNTGILTVDIFPSSPNILTILGYKLGVNSVMVRDSSSPFKTTSVTITVGSW
ncbi:MAG: hypothetical protein V1484_02095 [bacterium]